MADPVEVNLHLADQMQAAAEKALTAAYSAGWHAGFGLGLAVGIVLGMLALAGALWLRGKP